MIQGFLLFGVPDHQQSIQNEARGAAARSVTRTSQGLGGADCVQAVPRPIHAVSGRETKRWAGNRLPPSAQKVMFFR